MAADQLQRIQHRHTAEKEKPAGLMTPALASHATAACTDGELAAWAAGGDAAAFEANMPRHNRLLFRTARSILKSDAEAEDALREAHLRAWQALDTFRSEARLSTWLVRIVINEVLGRLRRRGAQVLPLGPTLAQDDATMEDVMEDVMEGNPDVRPDRGDAPVVVSARMARVPTSRIGTMRGATLRRSVADLYPGIFAIIFLPGYY